MFIEISDNKTIQDIQSEFSTHYPFLKLEFFETPYSEEGVVGNAMISPLKNLREVRKKHIYGVIKIDPERETAALEDEFERRFDLHAQVYRRLTDQWVETVPSDMLTLQEQNKLGMDSSVFYNPNHRH